MTAEKEAFIFSDTALSRRLERAEGRSNAEFVEARAIQFPESGARWIEVDGAFVMYDGAGSPLTQTFGLGLFMPVTHATMDEIESFYREAEAPIFHEVSPLADTALLAMLGERGYRPVELTSVMFRRVSTDLELAGAKNERIRVRRIEEGEHELWARVAARGWSEFAELADFILELSLVSAKRPNALSFIAELDGGPIATGAMTICEGVAVLAGASTVPEARRQGAQLALLHSRLQYAAERGCDIAMMCALPGSASQRNAERQGFRIAYTRTKWQHF